jgi:hypothetical protein
MANEMDFPAKGKVTRVDGKSVTFVPAGTNYELHLEAEGSGYSGAVNVPVEAVVRLRARKVMTVPSGGNFISPIFGPPRIVQGRVRCLSANVLVIHAGTNLMVELPASDSAFDLATGAIGMGSMVNATILPGGTLAMASKGTVAAS